MLYKFEEFILDKQRRILTKDGADQLLPSKVFETLLYLVEHRGKVVTKEELFENVWSGKFVEEGNLTQKIFAIRQILGEKKKEHRFIVTVPGEGYTFVAPVQEIPNENFTLNKGAGEILNSKTEADDFRLKTVAVLPFKFIARSEDASDDFLGIGLADSLVTRLSNSDNLYVRSTFSLLKYENVPEDLKSISEQLQVDFVIRGVIQKIRNELRISVQIVKAKDETTIWANRWNAESSSFFEIQDLISGEIAEALDLKLTRSSIKEPNYGGTTNYEAFQNYVKGRFFWNARTIEGLKKGVQFANQAVALDPTFAMAYVGLADSYILLAGQHSYLAPKEAFPKAKAAALRALEICPDLAEAQTSLAFITSWFDWDLQAGEKYFQRALDLKPNYPSAYHWYGEMLSAAGRHEESIELLKRAQELDPLSLAITADIAQSYLFARRYDDCEKVLRQILEMNPDFARGLYLNGLLCRQKNLLAESVENFEKAFALSPDDPTFYAELGFALAISRRFDEAAEILSQLEQKSARQYVSAFNTACIYFALGNTESAVGRLREAVEAKDVWLLWLNVHPKLDAYREILTNLEFINVVNRLV